jgi:hypothetical protein
MNEAGGDQNLVRNDDGQRNNGRFSEFIVRGDFLSTLVQMDLRLASTGLIARLRHFTAQIDSLLKF